MYIRSNRAVTTGRNPDSATSFSMRPEFVFSSGAVASSVAGEQASDESVSELLEIMLHIDIELLSVL